MPLSPHVIVLMGRKYVAPTNRSAVTPITELCDERFSRTLGLRCLTRQRLPDYRTQKQERLRLLVGPWRPSLTG